MNYTKNHHLPQWVKSDRIRMEDFNDAMSSIESGLTASTSAAGEAKAAASDAKAAAQAAQTAAGNAFTPDNKPFVVGSYTGDNAHSQIIELGFRPSFLIVSGMTQTTDGTDLTGNCPFFAITANSQNVSSRVQLVSVGFAVYATGVYDLQLPHLNDRGRHYDYIAFR